MSRKDDVLLPESSVVGRRRPPKETSDATTDTTSARFAIVARNRIPCCRREDDKPGAMIGADGSRATTRARLPRLATGITAKYRLDTPNVALIIVLSARPPTITQDVRLGRATYGIPASAANQYFRRPPRGISCRMPSGDCDGLVSRSLRRSDEDAAQSVPNVSSAEAIPSTPTDVANPAPTSIVSRGGGGDLAAANRGRRQRPSRLLTKLYLIANRDGGAALRRDQASMFTDLVAA